jgi:hypothetical protein
MRMKRQNNSLFHGFLRVILFIKFGYELVMYVIDNQYQKYQ